MDRTPIRVLFIEDSEVDRSSSRCAPEQGGFQVSWDRVDLGVFDDSTRWAFYHGFFPRPAGIDSLFSA